MCVCVCVCVCVDPNDDHQWQKQKLWRISRTTDPETVTINAHFVVVATFACFNNALTHSTTLSFDGRTKDLYN